MASTTARPEYTKLLDGLDRPFVGGAALREGGSRREHINPNDGTVNSSFTVGGAAEIDRAVKAAAAAQKQWIALPGNRRAAVLMRLAALIREHATRLTHVLAVEGGIPVSLGVELAAAWVEHFAGYADKLMGGTTADMYPMPGFGYTRKEPYGVIGVIIPWNHPLIASCQVGIPAIAAGNGLVIKPPSDTPFCGVLLAQLAVEAGMPPGLFNVVPGDAEAGTALIEHREVGKISFTGGGATARHVMAAAAKVLKPLFLELGGKSANLLFADAQLDTQVPFSLGFCMGLSGQGCVLPTRLLVEAPAYERVIEGLVATAPHLKLGNALKPDTVMGPVVNRAAQQRILGVIERAQREKQGRLVYGGKAGHGELAQGSFVEPTIFVDVDPDSSLARQEVFGPVLSVIRFRTEDEAVRIANDSEFGLGAYVQTTSLPRAQRLSAALAAGTVCINGASGVPPMLPFGGYKQSGFGRIGGREGLEEYLQTKAVFIG